MIISKSVSSSLIVAILLCFFFRYNVYEKLFHLGRYHVHNLPKVMALPFHGAQKALATFYNLQHSQQLS